MHPSIRILVAFALCVPQISDAKLPSFINRCRYNDPQIAKCILESAKEAAQHIIKGIEELQIPPLTRVRLPILHSVANERFLLTFDGNLEGLENIKFENSSFLKKQNKGVGKFSIPRIKLVGKYTINGTIEDIPVNSEGECTITFDNISITYGYTLMILTKNGLNYVKAVDPVLISYNMEENGNHKFSGRDNENEKKLWDLFSEEQQTLKSVLGPVVIENVVIICFDVANKIYDAAPMNEIFLP